MKTLQQLAFRKIIEAFDRYHQLYITTTDDQVKRGFLFLQKRYSEEILERLAKRGRLFEKYQQLLFNNYLENFDGEWIKNFSRASIIDIFKRIGPNLHGVVFTGSNYGHIPWTNVFYNLPNLRMLVLQQSFVEEVLEYIAEHCPRLEILDVSRAIVANQDLAHLCNKKKRRKRNIMGKFVEENTVPCPNLKHLYLSRTLVSEMGLGLLLKSLPSLTMIENCHLIRALYRFHKGDLGSLGKLETCNLTYLDISHLNSYPEDVLKVCAKVCPNLKSLHCGISTPKHLNMCLVLPDLEDLFLVCFRDISRFDEYFNVNSSVLNLNDFLKQKGGRLKYLTLRGIYTVSLSVLTQHCPYLVELTASGESIDYKGTNSDTSVFRNLKEFTVEKVNFPALSLDSEYRKSVLHILSSSPVLESFQMCHSSFDLVSCSDIEECCKQHDIRRILLGNSYYDAIGFQ